jgi:hypothetical protein
MSRSKADFFFIFLKTSPQPRTEIPRQAPPTYLAFREISLRRTAVVPFNKADAVALLASDDKRGLEARLQCRSRSCKPR